jgi:20S proteasome subunit alpha 4
VEVRCLHARVFVQRAQVECQLRRLTYEDSLTMKRFAQSIATLQPQSRQFVGKRPFGVTTLVCGFDWMNSPHICERLPNGAYTE